MQRIINDIVVCDNSSTHDKVVRGLTPNEVYTTSSAYHHIANHEYLDPGLQKSQDFKTIWKANVPNKLKHFLWILYHQRIKMNQRLHLLVVLTSPSCTICGHHSEDITHLFFKCYIASNFWKNLHLTRRWHINFDGSSLDSSTWMETWKWVKGQKNALLC